MHPFLDVSKLSDDEIIDRIGKAHSYMNAQKALGHVATVHSIEEIIDALENERNDRMNKNMTNDYSKKYPDDLTPIELGKLED